MKMEKQYLMVKKHNDIEKDEEIDSILDPEEKKSPTSYAFATLGLLAVTANMFLFAANPNYRSWYSSNLDASLHLKAFNEYGDYMSQMFQYPFLEDSLLAEPYRETTFVIMTTGQSCAYDWSITGQDFSEKGSVGINENSFQTTLFKTGLYNMSIWENCEGATQTTSTRYITQNLWVKYVRRELSTLTDSDREEFLDSFHKLWKVSTKSGRSLFGSAYKSVYHFAAVHNDAGGNPVCDEFHGDVGFANNHLFMSSYLEQSLQLINPKLALHYMDYTKYYSSDAFAMHIQNQLDGGNWSEIFSEKWFGSSDPYTGEILDGRWASTPVPTVDSKFYADESVEEATTFFPEEEEVWVSQGSAHVASPYGLLRSPWNYNPAPYTVRYNSVHGIPNAQSIDSNAFKYYGGVTCKSYESFIGKIKGQGLSSYLTYAEGDIHGIVHFTIGGHGGQNAGKVIQQLRDSYGFDDTSVVMLALSAQTFFKYYLAQNSVHFERQGGVFPLTCSELPWQNNKLVSAAEPGEDGGPTCTFSDDYLADEDSLNELVDMFFSQDINGKTKGIINSLEFDERVSVMKLIGGMFQYDGDMDGSGAPTDPMFWVVHGAVERLFQYSVFQNWISDFDYVRQKRVACSGHMENSTKTWLTGFYLEDPSIKSGELTNAQLSQMLVPTGSEYRDLLNYVYDSSTYSWCDTSGW